MASPDSTSCMLPFSLKPTAIQISLSLGKIEAITQALSDGEMGKEFRRYGRRRNGRRVLRDGEANSIGMKWVRSEFLELVFFFMFLI